MADDYDIGAACDAIEDELIASMIRNLRRHKNEEVKEDKQWSMWQMEQLRSLENYRRENQKRFKPQFARINKKIDELIRTAKQEGGMEQEIAILKAIKEGFPRQNAKGATAEFFLLNKEKLEALIKATTDDMQKAETAILRMANDQYRKIIFNAQLYANTGAGTYEKAVDMATKDMLAAGLNCVEYKNGARHTLADYADMAIKTASKRAYLQGEGEKRQEWSIATVIMNKRQAPCPKCLPWVGKVLIDDVWSGGSKDGKSTVTGLKYPLMSKAIEKGLYHPRCKDVHSTYFEGISTPPEGSKYTADELDEIAEHYWKEQKQQYAKHEAKKYDRLAKYSLDKENQERYQAKADVWKTVAKPSEPVIIELSEDELGAIQRYKSFEAYIINEALRTVDNVEALSPKQRRFVKELDSAISKLKTYEGNLIRTINFSDWPDCAERTEKFVKDLIPGKIIKIKQYWSTSKKYGYDDKAGIRIFIQDSKKGRDISSIGLDEKEVIYERGIEFEIVARLFQNGIWKIILREV